jgi:hypothetical protein
VCRKRKSYWLPGEMASTPHLPNERKYGPPARAITGDTALRLAHSFRTSPEFWLNLQSLHEIRLEEQKPGKSIKTLPTNLRNL